MNERYLFRGKMISGQWIQGFLCDRAGSFSTIVMDREMISVLTETLGQCTGERDCNDQLIWEGDLVENRKGERGVIRHDEWGFWMDYNGTLYRFPSQFLRVLGVAGETS